MQRVKNLSESLAQRGIYTLADLHQDKVSLWFLYVIGCSFTLVAVQGPGLSVLLWRRISRGRRCPPRFVGIGLCGRAAPRSHQPGAPGREKEDSIHMYSLIRLLYITLHRMLDHIELSTFSCQRKFRNICRHLNCGARGKEGTGKARKEKERKRAGARRRARLLR